MANTAGGADWASAGVIDSSGACPSTPSTVSAGAGPEQPYWPVWWTISFADDHLVTLDMSATTPSYGDSYLKVYSGPDYASRVVVAYDDDSGDGNMSKLSFTAVGGVTYHVAAGAYSSGGVRGGMGTYEMLVTSILATPPPNDDIADAIPVSLSEEVEVVVAFATLETGETDVCGPWTYRSVWYEFVATYSGFFGMDVFECDGSSSPEWTLWTGTDFGDLTQVDHGYGYGPYLSYHCSIVAGTRYLLRVAAQSTSTSTITFRPRRLDWGPWNQDADFSLGCSAYRGYVASENTTPARSGPHHPLGTDLVPDLNSLISSSIDDMTFDVGSDALVTGAAGTGSPGYIGDSGVPGGSDIDFRPTPVQDVFGSAETWVDNCFIGHSMYTLFMRPTGLTTYSSSGAVQYESPLPKAISATLRVKLRVSKVRPDYVSSGSFDAWAEVYSYTPAINASVPDSPYIKSFVSSHAADLDQATPQVTTDLTFAEADLAGLFDGADVNNQYNGIACLALLHATDPVYTSFAYGIGALGPTYSAQITADTAASSWTLRPPRYRSLEYVDYIPPVTGGWMVGEGLVSW